MKISEFVKSKRVQGIVVLGLYEILRGLFPTKVPDIGNVLRPLFGIN